jgi:hypothetical protein
VIDKIEIGIRKVETADLVWLVLISNPWRRRRKTVSKLDVAVTFLAFVREVPSSNVGHDCDSHD